MGNGSSGIRYYHTSKRYTYNVTSASSVAGLGGPAWHPSAQDVCLYLGAVSVGIGACCTICTSLIISKIGH